MLTFVSMTQGTSKAIPARRWGKGRAGIASTATKTTEVGEVGSRVAADLGNRQRIFTRYLSWKEVPGAKVAVRVTRIALTRAS